MKNYILDRSVSPIPVDIIGILVEQATIENYRPAKGACNHLDQVLGAHNPGLRSKV
ncbi:MAG: hypothetical protein ACREX9_18395 [Gammaproteobacteria bacterium]